jgi:L-malate glycosyltransferase
MPRKLLVIGSNSPHVTRFIYLVKELFDEIVYVGETNLQTDLPVKQHLVNFRSANPFSLLSNYKKLKRIIASENPDVTHIQQVNRVAFAAARAMVRLQKKYIVTAWGSDVLIAPHKNLFYKKITNFVLDHATQVTADSNQMTEAIHKLSPAAPCELVFFGIDPIIPAAKEKIVYSNRLLKELYNIAAIIDEYNGFQKTHAGWKLVIAGSGDQEEFLRKKVAELNLADQVTFAGWLSRQENIQWYKKAAIYISIPFSDGTSVSLLEAMSAGCIPVLSDLPVSHEWIKDGENGVIKKAGENALIRALNLDPAKVAAINAEIIDSRATGLITTQQFKSIYERTGYGSTDKK